MFSADPKALRHRADELMARRVLFTDTLVRKALTDEARKLERAAEQIETSESGDLRHRSVEHRG